LLDNLYDPAYERCEDFELWLRTMGTTQHARLRNALLFYRDPCVISIDKHRRSLHSAVKALRTHGRGQLTLRGFVRRMLYINARRVVVPVAAGIGMSTVIVRRRNSALVGADAERAREALRRALLVGG
jgi:hypothetical protein